MPSKNMSLESSLDEERRDVLAILEGATPPKMRTGSGSSAVGQNSSHPTPRSPIRSMLDIDSPAPRSASAAGPSAALSTPPRKTSFRSMLDIGGSPPRSASSSRSAQTSPTDANHRAVSANMQHRSMSDAAAKPAGFGPRAPGFEKPSPYQFLASTSGASAAQTRNILSGRKIPSAMAEVMGGRSISSLGSKERGQQLMAGSSISNTAKSRSPHNRLGLRSNSPHVSKDPNKFVLKDGRVLDMSSAYRRFSDANLALSGGSLSALSEQGRRRRTNSDNGKSAGNRLEKEYMAPDGEDALMDSSDEDHVSSDEERQRGRKKPEPNGVSRGSKTLGIGTANGPRAAQSLLAAAEEERVEIVAKQPVKYKVRSLLEPEITVTGPLGDRSKPSKTGGVHPHTSFDETASGINTPMDSDTEADITDIKRAQKLAVNTTKIMSTPSTGRCVQTIYRGDFGKMQQEAHDNQRRVRKYLVATDLSDEAAHALEWTIGTVLRDGDTLLAIYCVDEEVGIANDNSGDDAHLQEQALAVAESTKSLYSTPQLIPVLIPSPLGPGTKLETDSANASPAGRERGKAEQERYRAVQDIAGRVSKLLRKTKLQVKVVIEVIHCKSPKHLITEVIDFISPTLVILGSRGRSALKGVILGSFSNYLVTKSSVPVMVARKRLRKHTKYKRPAIKLANNLSTPSGGIAHARID